MNELLFRGGVLDLGDGARCEISVELAFLIAIDGGCGVQLGRRSVRERGSAAKQRAGNDVESRGDERERNDPEQRDRQHQEAVSFARTSCATAGQREGGE